MSFLCFLSLCSSARDSSRPTNLISQGDSRGNSFLRVGSRRRRRGSGKTSRGFWAKPREGESLRRRWFESQSCRVDSLQALLDDLDDLVRADAARARRATRGRAGIVAAAALGGLAAYVVLPLAL